MAVVADTGVRTRTIVVGIVGDRWSGALAYALKVSLAEAAKVRIVRVAASEPCERPQLSLPLHVVEAAGDPARVLVLEAKGADLLVIECEPDPDHSTVGDGPVGDGPVGGDPVLADVRQHCDALLIEVDADGEIVRASGAAGWTYATQPDMTFAMPTSAPCHERAICVGVDGSPASQAAVEWSAAMAARTGSTLTLVSVHSADPTSAHRSRVDAQDDIAAAARLVPDARAASVVSSGEPAECLVEAARGASMLVLGRHGTRGLIHSALGSVGETCARLADCPVVIVPHT